MIPEEHREALRKAVDNAIEEITASHMRAWSTRRDQIDEFIRNDAELNQLIDTKQWLDTLPQAPETTGEKDMIPNDVREALDEILAVYYQSRKHDPTFDISLHDTVLAWLDTLPQAPEPNWSQAPEWAQAHVFNCHGSGLWIESSYVETNVGGASGWLSVVSGLNSDYSGCHLPLGIDWRTTLRQRPG